MTRTMRTLISAASVAVVLGLAGCTPGPTPELAAEQAAAFRAQVVAVADTSSRGDYANALAALDQLEAEVDAAVAAGELDPEREQRIRDAIALVRADLDAAIAAALEAEQAAETPAPEDDEADDDGDDGDDGGPGNSDEGKSKGKGKDKD